MNCVILKMIVVDVHYKFYNFLMFIYFKIMIKAVILPANTISCLSFSSLISVQKWMVAFGNTFFQEKRGIANNIWKYKWSLFLHYTIKYVKKSLWTVWDHLCQKGTEGWRKQASGKKTHNQLRCHLLSSIVRASAWKVEGLRCNPR